MSSFVSLTTPAPHRPTLPRRLELLEQRCAELWAAEPLVPSDRERAFARLSEIENRVVGLSLTSLAEPDDPSLRVGAEGCERDLEQLGALWAAPRAA